ncbi:MAG: calcium/sodium antiporter [bacterium]|nr:calcium/sodium antiporter [bacterium]
MSLSVALGVLAVCFLVLTKCASWFVDGAVGIAEYLNVPKMLIGIVLVSLATTSPELAVSVMSALSGNPEIALGNAVGSVIVDDGVALGLGALLATSPILVNPYLLRTTGIFLIVVDVLAYVMVFDGTLDRLEGGVLVALFVVYMVFAYTTRKRSIAAESALDELAEIEEAVAGRGLGMLMVWFGVGLVGVLIASHFIVESSVAIADHFEVSKALIGLTVVAIGTSLPEIATAVTAARKGHGGIVVGNILGADILNICWIAGASALVNPLVVSTKVIHFSFPAMLIIVITMLVLMRTRHSLSRSEGLVLLGTYAVYLGLMVRTFL